MRNTLLLPAFAWSIILLLPTILVGVFVSQDLAVKIGFGTYVGAILVAGILATKDVR